MNHKKGKTKVMVMITRVRSHLTVSSSSQSFKMVHERSNVIVINHDSSKVTVIKKKANTKGIQTDCNNANNLIKQNGFVFFEGPNRML